MEIKEKVSLQCQQLTELVAESFNEGGKTAYNHILSMLKTKRDSLNASRGGRPSNKLYLQPINAKSEELDALICDVESWLVTP